MRRVDRRSVFGIWATSLVSAATAACGERGASVVQTPEGPVLQLERDELLVLVSGFQDTYRVGEQVAVKVIVNNQSRRFATARIRTRVLGRGQQAVAEAEVATINIRPTDATAVDRAILLPTTLSPGAYTLQVELPPWSFEGRQTGGGALTYAIRVEPA